MFVGAWLILSKHNRYSTCAVRHCRATRQKPLGGLRPPIHHGSKRWFVVHEP